VRLLLQPVLDASSTWTRWTDFDAAKRQFSTQGIYFLAHLDEVPAGLADPIDPHVLYIGGSFKPNASMFGRLKAFEKSVRENQIKHSGAGLYLTTTKNVNRMGKPACVACIDLHGTGANYIRFAERLVLWAYERAHGRLPQCNKE